MVPSLSALRGVLHALMLTAGLLITMVLNQTLKTVSLAKLKEEKEVTFQECNETICKTTLSEK